MIQVLFSRSGFPVGSRKSCKCIISHFSTQLHRLENIIFFLEKWVMSRNVKAAALSTLGECCDQTLFSISSSFLKLQRLIKICRTFKKIIILLKQSRPLSHFYTFTLPATPFYSLLIWGSQEKFTKHKFKIIPNSVSDR